MMSGYHNKWQNCTKKRNKNLLQCGRNQIDMLEKVIKQKCIREEIMNRSNPGNNY